ncbi:hypothetical protein FOMPIDRAFT_1094484, partial [Fomitopsis schrenkii]
MFTAVKTVFSRNSELFAGENGDRKVRARKLITKIVNALSASAETGAPMACMYLLGNPDHYTSHKFKPFYWRNYKYEVMKAWTGYVGLTQQMDYIYRPAKYEDVCLYDWIQCAEKTTMSQAKKTALKKTKEIHEKELNVKHEMRDTEPSSQYTVAGSCLPKNESHSDDELLHTNTSATSHPRDVEKNGFVNDFYIDALFLPTHPQHETHVAFMQPQHASYVPNFVGGALPRRDKGNREEYCLVMLMLFKPWRSGASLKCADQTWDSAFSTHEFSTQQNKIMNFFHIRYECNDSRDDFSTKRDLEDSNQIAFDNDDVDNDIDSEDYADIVQSSLTGNDGAIDYDPQWDVLGQKALGRIAQMKLAENIARSSGWLD